MPKKTISFNIDEADLLKIDGYAAAHERDRTYILNRAVKMYIDQAERFRAEVEEASHGQYYTQEQVIEHLKADRELRRAKQEQQARKAS
jgi:predicted transcriptional regulator